MRIVVAIALGLLACGPAAAEKVVVGGKGGFWCKSIDDLTAARAGNPGSSCRILTPQFEFEAAYVDSDKDAKFGIGTFSGGVNAPFVIFTGAVPAPSAVVPESRTFKRVSPNDVRNTPGKWRGRDIEFANVSIYWVSSDDVRVVTGTNVTLFATKTRSADNSYFATNCETEAEALSKKCRATVRFNYDEFGEDQPTGLFKRTILRSGDVELIRASRGR